MSEAAMGACVMYGNHKGWFIADIFKIGGVNVVKANHPPHRDFVANLERNELSRATHHISDFPNPGVWMPERGVFVVLATQVIEVEYDYKTKEVKRK